jgi:PelA/Pel-15E family pectate lyase
MGTEMKRRSFVIPGVLAAMLCAQPSLAAVIGANTPSLPVTVERIDALAATQKAEWSAYLERSQAQSRADRAALAAELPAGKPRPEGPPHGKGNVPLDKDAAWYASPEARAIAANIVSFQTPAGGWGKNQDRSGPPRAPGQSYVIEEAPSNPPTGNFDTPADVHWHYVGTIDNGATTSEIRFLARVAAKAPGHEGEAWRTSFIKGVRYLLAAQYPNGGWPQIWPLEGGYHDAVTFNDNAIADVAGLLDEIGAGEGDFAFAPADLRAAAAAENRKAVSVILKSQVVIDGKRTVWPQQADALTLAPTSARNYEMPSLSSSESGDLLVYLMKQPDPGPEMKAAIRAGVAWLEAHAIKDKAWSMTANGRALTSQPGAPPIWSRYYSLTTGQPIFGDRDRTIHDDVADLSAERRGGYSWYNTTAAKALKAYAKWSEKHP